MRKLILVVATLGLVAAACGEPTPSGASSTSGPGSTTTSPSTSQPPSGDTLPTCYEAPLPAADPSLYRDTPKYVGNEMPTDAVREWASQYPEFADIWIDRDHNGWVAVGFTDNVAERQAEIEEVFPDEGVVAVHLESTAAELEDLHTRVRAELSGVVELQGSSVDTLRGYVNLMVPVRSEETLDAIAELFPDEPICVEGLEPEDVVPPGPQPQAGDGWRLLVDQDEVGDVFRVEIAWDQQSLATLLDGIPGLADVDLDVDLENEVVIWFGAVHGSSCPNLRLDDVIVEGDTVSAAIVNTENAIACTDDAIPHTYLVGLARDRLPAPPFYLTLDERGFGERLRVDADLRETGSVAAPGEVSSDPKTQEPEGSGVIIETGFPWEYTVDLTCGFEALGEINDYHWMATEPIPDSWVDAAEGSESVVVEVLLHEGPEPLVEVTFQGETITYEVGDGPGCSPLEGLSKQPELSREYWSSYSYDAVLEAENFSSLQAMYESVESVAVVRFSRLVEGPSVWLPDESDDVGALEYTGVEVDVLEPVKGDLAGTAVLMGMRIEDIEYCCPVLLFMRSMPLVQYLAAGEVVEAGDIALETTVHRFVNSQAAFIEVDGLVENPMSERNRPSDQVRADAYGTSMSQLIAKLGT